MMLYQNTFHRMYQACWYQACWSSHILRPRCMLQGMVQPAQDPIDGAPHFHRMPATTGDIKL